MNFGYTILYVDNVPASVDFYERAFGFQKKFITPEEDYAELLTGATTLAFASTALASSNFREKFLRSSPEQTPFGLELAFVTEQIEADFQRALAAGAHLVAELTQKPWGQQVGYLKDNNGFLIELCTPINN